MADVQPVQSLERAFDILERLCKIDGSVAIRDLVAETGLNKSTIYRMLQTMAARGYVAQEPSSGKYYMTTKLFTLSSHVIEHLDLVSVAREPMLELSHALQETVHLVIQDGSDILYVHKVETSPDSVRMASRLGMRRPLYSTASGKVLLAYCKKEVAEAIWRNSTIIAFTPSTITTFSLLEQQLESIRQNGYAIDFDENEAGIRCIAAPIRDYTGNVSGALSISVPQQHGPYHHIESLSVPLLHTCDLISSRLGFYMA